MKKYLLNIGAVATALAPIATVVSCAKETKTPVVPSINVDSARADKALKLVKESEFETEMNKTLTPEVKKKSAGDVNEDQKAAIKTGILSLIRNKMDGTEVEKSNAQTKVEIAFETSTEGTTLITNITVKDIEGTRTIYNNGFNKSSIDVQTTNKAVGLITNAILDKLVDKTKFASVEKSKITKTSILKLDEIKNLTNEQKALIAVKAEADDANGTLKVVIEVKGGKKNTIALAEFLTTGQENIAKAEAAIANVTDTMLNTLVVKGNKASTEKSKITDVKIRSLDIFSKLNADQKALITVASIADDAAGTLKITISVAGGTGTKTATLKGFLTTANDNIAKAEAAIAKVTDTMLNNLVVKGNKASVEKSKITDAKIRSLDVFSSLNADQKALITVASVADDANGTLKITISVTGGEATKTVTLSGFLTTGQENIAKAEAAIANVTDTMLNTLVVKGNKASTEKAKIKDIAIRKLEAFKDLTDDQKALITVASVADDANGTLKITISVAGGAETKTVTLSGFLTTGQENIAKAEAAIAKVTDTMLNNLVVKGNKASTEKAKIKNAAIRELEAFKDLSDDQKALITVASVADDANGTLKITISVTGGAETKTVTLSGFKTATEAKISLAKGAIDKFQDYNTFSEQIKSIINGKSNDEVLKITKKMIFPNLDAEALKLIQVEVTLSEDKKMIKFSVMYFSKGNKDKTNWFKSQIRLVK